MDNNELIKQIQNALAQVPLSFPQHLIIQNILKKFVVDELKEENA